MLVCPKCGRYEYVRISGKNSERAMCEDCELFFDVQSAEGSKHSGIRDKAEGVIQALQAYGYRVWFAAGSLRRREIG